MAAKKPPLDKAGLLGLDDRPVITWTVPAWKRAVTLRAPNAGHVLGLSELETSLDQTKELIRFGIVNGDGEPMFGPDEVDELFTKSPIALSQIVTKLREITGIGAEVEDAAGN